MTFRHATTADGQTFVVGSVGEGLLVAVRVAPPRGLAAVGGMSPANAGARSRLGLSGGPAG